jgi:putative transposase
MNAAKPLQLATPASVSTLRLAGMGHVVAVPGHGGALRPATRGEIVQMDVHRKGAYQLATDAQRLHVHNWECVFAEINRIKGFGSLTSAVNLFLARAKAGDLTPRVLDAFAALAVGTKKQAGKLPGRSTVFEALSDYEAEGPDGLVKRHKGRVRIEGGWEGFAIEQFSQTTQPDMSAIHRVLFEVHKFKVGYDQVRGYLTKLPANIGRMSPARIGASLYKLQQKVWFRRCIDNALPGDIYAADGYRADIYLAHPVTGGIWRPELTVAMDVASRHIVHVRADEHEGTYAVQNMWAEAFTRWGHVPLQLYVDNGSGHSNHLMCDDVSGFYSRAGVQYTIFATPGNPHGKGWIERFFRTMKDDFLRVQWAQFCCADEQADEVLNRLTREVKAGRVQLPSLAQFMDSLNDWLDRYHSRPVPGRADRLSKAELWAQLQAVPPPATLQVLKHRSEPRKVTRASLTQGGRTYTHPSLHQWNGQSLLLEYSLTDDSVAIVRTLEGRFVCDAHLVQKKQQFSDSRMDELRKGRERQQIKRKEAAIAEDKARAGLVIDADAVAMGVIDMAPTTPLLQDASDDDITLDLTEIFNRNDNNQPEEDL